MKLKRMKLSQEPLFKFFGEQFGDDLVIYVMQFLDASNTLRFAKTCKRFACLYKQGRGLFCRFESFWKPCLRLKSPTPAFREVIISGDGSWLRNFKLIDGRQQDGWTDFTISNEHTEVSITEEPPKWSLPIEKNSRCFIRKGTHLQAFILLARYLSENSVFRELNIEGMNAKMLAELSGCRFYVRSLSVKNCANVTEEMMLTWAGMLRPDDQFFFYTDTAFNLSRAVFDDPRFRRKARVTVKFDEESQSVCELNDTDLKELIWRSTNVSLINTVTSITLHGIRSVVDRWTTSEEAIACWNFYIRSSTPDIKAAFRDQFRGFESDVEEHADRMGWRCIVRHTTNPRRRFFVVLHPGVHDSGLLGLSLSEFFPH